MPTVLRFRRGDTTASNAFTGAEGELFVDTTKDTVVVHDGVTAGGKPLATEAALISGLAGKQDTLVSGTNIKTVNGTSLLGSGNIVISGGGASVVSGSVSGNTLTLTNSDSSTVNIQLPSSATGFLPSEVSEDMLPQFDAVYDLGSPTERWYDVNVSNSVKIGAATLSETNGVLTVNTEIVASNLTGTDLVANEALIGTALHTGSTITPEGTPLEYGDIKGTLTVDGNLVVADDLHVRNKIAVKQTPVTLGAVTGFSTIPSTSSQLTVDNNGASTANIRYIMFASQGNTNTMYFGDAPSAAAKSSSMTVGSTLGVTFYNSMSGNTYNGVAQITDVWYTQGNSQIDFRCNFISGTAPWDIAAWTNWRFPWWSPDSYQLVSLTFNQITPPQYVVAFDGTTPALSTISKLYKNGVSTVGGTTSYASLSDFAAALVGPNEPMYLNNFSFQMSAGDEYLIVSTMSGQSTAYYNVLQSCSSFTLTDVSTGYNWTIHPGTQLNSPWGNAMLYTVVSASNPSYPTPRSVQTAYVGTAMRITVNLQVDLLSSLTLKSTSVFGTNRYSSVYDIRELFSVGDVVTYKVPTTSLVFGDESSGLSKAITYNETTGAITYAGLVSPLNFNSTTSALYTSNYNSSQTLGTNSVTIGGNAYGSGDFSTAIGYNANAGYGAVSIGQGAHTGQYSVSVGQGDASGSYATYVGYGGSNIGGMYHNTVIGMLGQSSSGWMWGNGQHVAALGTVNSYIQSAGDYATIINGGNSSYHMSASNLIGGSTSFAPQQYHAEIDLSAFQYAYITSTSTIYPQFGYYANSGAPLQMSTSPSTDSASTLRLDQNNCQIAQGKVILTVQQRNTDVWGIYEIVFIARKSATGTMSIISQTTTTLGNNNAATYWNAPSLYLNGGNLQFQITPTASMNSTYMSVHVGGNVRVSAPY